MEVGGRETREREDLLEIGASEVPTLGAQSYGAQSFGGFGAMGGGLYY